MYTAVIRIKYGEIGSWVKSAVTEGRFPEIPDSIHVATEGSDTVNFHPMAAATLEDLQDNLKNVALFAVENVGGYNEDLCSLLKILCNNLGDRMIDKPFSMQYRYQGAPFIDVGINHQGA